MSRAGRGRAGALTLTLVLAGACRDAPPGAPADAAPPVDVGDAAVDPGDAAPRGSWPTLPRTREAQRALIAASTRRPVPPATDGGTEASLAALAAASLARLDHAVAGEAAIRAWLDAWLARAGARDAYVLFGTHHDSGAQVRAFRALVRHPTPLTEVVLEHLVADGRWAGLALDAQRGDDADLGAFLERGDLTALERLRRAHAAHDVTAWKFDYEGDVLDVVLAARATGRRVSACDAPRAVREALAEAGDGASDDVNRARELHCLRALEDRGTGPGPRRVAMLWGHDHARPSGLARFLPPEAAVLAVHLFGGRAPAFAERPPPVVLNEPILVAATDAASPSEVALWLPDPRTRGDVDRVRRAPEPATPTEVRASSLSPATLTLTSPALGDGGDGGPSATRTVPLGRGEAVLPARDGHHTYVLRGGGVTVIGGLSLARGERATLSFDLARRSTRVELEARP